MTDTITDNFLDQLQGPPPKDKRTKCYYVEWFATLAPEHQKAMDAAMHNPKWKSTSLYQIALSKGYEKQYNSLRLHRATILGTTEGGCSCKVTA